MKKLRVKVINAVILFVFICMFFSSLFVYLFKLNSEKSQRISDTYDQIGIADAMLAQRINSVEELNEILFYNKDVYDFMQNNSSDEESFNEYIEKCLYSNPYIKGAVFITSDGTEYIFGIENQSINITRLQILLNMNGEEKYKWFTSAPNDEAIAMDSDTVIAGKLIFENKNLNISQKIAKVYYYIDKKIFSIKTEDNNSSLVVTDNTGSVISCTNDGLYKEVSNKKINEQERIYSLDKGFVSTNANGGRVFIVHCKSDKTDYHYIKIIPVAPDNDDLVKILLFFTALFVLISGSAFLYINKRFISPTSEFAKKIADFDIDNIKPFETDKKYDYLNMGDSLNEIIKNIEKIKNQMAESERNSNFEKVRSLSYQIRPHFIYNSLSSIRMTAIQNNDDEVAATILALNKILKLVFSNTNKYVPLSAEFENADNYVKLMQLRYKNKFKFSYEIEENASILVPAMILQPIIENALIHGLVPKMNNENFTPYIHLGVKSYEDYCVVEIFDNGCGISNEKIRKILKTDESSESVGINNVNKRLKLLFGDEYGITIKSEENSYTSVYIKIPRNKDDEQE